MALIPPGIIAIVVTQNRIVLFGGPFVVLMGICVWLTGFNSDAKLAAGWVM